MWGTAEARPCMVCPQELESPGFSRAGDGTQAAIRRPMRGPCLALPDLCPPGVFWSGRGRAAHLRDGLKGDAVRRLLDTRLRRLLDAAISIQTISIGSITALPRRQPGIPSPPSAPPSENPRNRPLAPPASRSSCHAESSQKPSTPHRRTPTPWHAQGQEGGPGHYQRPAHGIVLVAALAGRGTPLPSPADGLRRTRTSAGWRKPPGLVRQGQWRAAWPSSPGSGAGGHQSGSWPMARRRTTCMDS